MGRCARSWDRGWCGCRRSRCPKCMRSRVGSTSSSTCGSTEHGSGGGGCAGIRDGHVLSRRLRGWDHSEVLNGSVGLTSLALVDRARREIQREKGGDRMMKKWIAGFAFAVLSLFLEAVSAVAQVFPVDTASTTVISNVKADIVAWGVVFISVLLTIYAYKKDRKSV